jgi:hypothetical protein
MDNKLADAIELVHIGAGKHGYRSYPGSGGLWVGDPNGTDGIGIADASFTDWGLARAVAEILNAVLDGRLIGAEQLAELDTFVATHQYTLDKNPPALCLRQNAILRPAIARHRRAPASGGTVSAWRCAVIGARCEVDGARCAASGCRSPVETPLPPKPLRFLYR